MSSERERERIKNVKRCNYIDWRIHDATARSGRCPRMDNGHRVILVAEIHKHTQNKSNQNGNFESLKQFIHWIPPIEEIRTIRIVIVVNCNLMTISILMPCNCITLTPLPLIILNIYRPLFKHMENCNSCHRTCYSEQEWNWNESKGKKMVNSPQCKMEHTQNQFNCNVQHVVFLSVCYCLFVCV